jgi:hypothetical protein
MGGDIRGTATRNCCGVLDNPLVGPMSDKFLPMTRYAALHSEKQRMRKKTQAIHRKWSPTHMENGLWQFNVEAREVWVMATADGWAMVRRPRCAPYVCRERELEIVKSTEIE